MSMVFFVVTTLVLMVIAIGVLIGFGKLGESNDDGGVEYQNVDVSEPPSDPRKPSLEGQEVSKGKRRGEIRSSSSDNPRLSSKQCSLTVDQERLVDGEAFDDSEESPWMAVCVRPRIDVQGKHFGSEYPEYQMLLEQNERTGEYRTRKLSDVADFTDDHE